MLRLVCWVTFALALRSGVCYYAVTIVWRNTGVGGKKSKHDVVKAHHLAPEKAREVAYLAKKFGMTQEEALKIMKDAADRLDKDDILKRLKK
ncbi:hypothetical protein LGH82_03290 [Mesorhizobium sp. PAMC28654]|uniref:hypothetical protein n=1 Tax=Mesorhizobium sp. PAMC28654 TaxID=2880934 RepID=UPI001D0A72DB|nr:hypothetical protein [Mesorhizobium sp. PAMC28654]UDL90412.1 hypothetical protein LGH82_03290 [Mesorhizobium sp. PAMC28654]